MAAALLALAAAGRISCNLSLEMDALASASVVLAGNLLNVAMPFEFLGGLVITLYKMLIGDIFQWVPLLFPRVSSRLPSGSSAPSSSAHRPVRPHPPVGDTVSSSFSGLGAWPL